MVKGLVEQREQVGALGEHHVMNRFGADQDGRAPGLGCLQGDQADDGGRNSGQCRGRVGVEMEAFAGFRIAHAGRAVVLLDAVAFVADRVEAVAGEVLRQGRAQARAQAPIEHARFLGRAAPGGQAVQDDKAAAGKNLAPEFGGLGVKGRQRKFGGGKRGQVASLFANCLERLL